MPFNYQLNGQRIWVAGHTGMVGSAVCRRLSGENCAVLTVSRAALDLENQADVQRWILDQQPTAIILAAAKVGGINANQSAPVDFLASNIRIQTNIMNAAHHGNVERLLFLGSSCIYPRLAKQPLKEEYLLTGALEKSNEWYAIAKIAGLKLVDAYRRQYGRRWISAMPTNLYGPGDNYDLQSSHVLPALLRKCHEAKFANQRKVSVWGSGSPLREFLHCDDLADALVFLLKHYDGDSHINVGSGEEVSIKKVAEIIIEVVGAELNLEFDSSKPDGTPRKLLDCSKLSSLGWEKTRPLREGIADTYRDWLASNSYY